MEQIDVEYGERMEVDLDNKLHVEVYIGQDEDVESPREWDNLGVMACWHRNYNLGDEQPSCRPSEWEESMAIGLDKTNTIEDRIWYWNEGNGWKHLMKLYGKENYYKRACDESDKKVKDLVWQVLDREMPVILPLFLYEHSGITMSTNGYDYPFNDRWDAGQVGWIYATRDAILKEYGGKRVTRKMLAKVADVLRAEVKTYDMYLTGDVYGFDIKVYSDGKCAFDDSCGGYYGSDYMLREINESVKKFGFELV